MALIKIESAEVLRHVGSRGAFAVGEYITLPTGASFQKQYTIWAEGEAPAVGSIVGVVGQLGMKIREYAAPSGMKHAIDVSVNEPEVTLMGAAKPATVEETAAAIQDIAATTGKDLPF
jgi:hypothetical protein